MMASTSGAIVLTPPAAASSTALRSTSWGKVCILRFSRYQARSRSHRVVGVSHFGSSGSSSSSSSSSSNNRSPLVRPRDPRLLHRCCRASSKIASPMNSREPLSGKILAELDSFEAKNQNQAAIDESRQCQVEKPTPGHVLWKVLQQGAVFVLATIIAGTFLPKGAHAVAENSIGASSLGIKVAEFLRRSGLSDEMVVLTVAMLPVLELRGAIPISYWLKIEPVKGCLLAVIGNMIPVPFILLYLEPISKYLGEKSRTIQRIVDWVFERARRKAGPIEEFQWIGLMLFVAVPLPGTGAWTGAIAASILGMPFWNAISANFLGVLLAGLLVNLFVRIGAKEAFIVGVLTLASSFFMWSVLRVIQQKKRT